MSRLKRRLTSTTCLTLLGFSGAAAAAYIEETQDFGDSRATATLLPRSMDTTDSLLGSIWTQGDPFDFLTFTGLKPGASFRFEIVGCRYADLLPCPPPASSGGAAGAVAVSTPTAEYAQPLPIYLNFIDSQGVVLPEVTGDSGEEYAAPDTGGGDAGDNYDDGGGYVDDGGGYVDDGGGYVDDGGG
jgi:hypothetical protein